MTEGQASTRASDEDLGPKEGDLQLCASGVATNFSNFAKETQKKPKNL